MRNLRVGDKVYVDYPNPNSYEWNADCTRKQVYIIERISPKHDVYTLNNKTHHFSKYLKQPKSLVAKLFLMLLITGTAFAQECEMDSVLACRDIPKEMRAVIIAQAKLESANFTSKLYKENCNAFGMRHPVIRPTRSRSGKAIAEGKRGYASYGSLAESVEDMVLYLKYFEVPPQPPKKYVRQLKSVGYFGSSERSYFNGITVHIKSSVCSNVL